MALTIHLRDDLKRFVEREVSTGRYASEGDVIEAALEQLADAPEPVIEPTMTVAEVVARAMEQYRRGEGEPYTDSFMAESRVRPSTTHGEDTGPGMKFATDT